MLVPSTPGHRGDGAGDLVAEERGRQDPAGGGLQWREGEMAAEERKQGKAVREEKQGRGDSREMGESGRHRR